MKVSRLENFTVSFFSIFLGLGGFSLLLQRIEPELGLEFRFSNIVFALTILLFISVLIIFTARYLKYPKAIRAEYKHPIKVNFFATTSISLLIFSIFLLEISKTLSFYLWIPGTILHLFFTLSVMSAWTRKDHFKREHLNPAWFIPIVGNILIPIAGVVHLPKDVSWFFFSVGIIYWILLFAIIQNRIIFHKTLPEKLRPTLFILIAPPAIGFISYIKLNGELDNFARILYFFGVFLFVKLIYQFRLFLNPKFYLSWWAYSFPIAALGLSSILMYHKSHATIYFYFSLSLLILLAMIILGLAYKTLLSIYRHELCVPETEDKLSD
jgi:tellurite resistance protein